MVLASHPSTAARRPGFIENSSVGKSLSLFSANHLNFFRVHFALFILVPFIASGIFYASDVGPNQISYIDALFVVVSASTVTGLSSIESSSMSTWQQVLLFLLMCVGSTSFVSIITIVIRKAFFKRKFDYLIAHNAELRRKVADLGTQEAARNPIRTKVNELVHHHHLVNDNASPTPLPSEHSSATPNRKGGKKKNKPERITLDMVRRVDTPVKVNQMNVGGYLREEEEVAEHQLKEEGDIVPDIVPDIPQSPTTISGIIENRQASNNSSTIRSPTTTEREHIEFGADQNLRIRRTTTRPLDSSHDHRSRRLSHSHNPRSLTRTGTYPPGGSNSMSSGFGGLPNPIVAVAGLVRRLPVIAQFERSMTLPRTTTLASVHTIGNGRNGKSIDRTKTVTYLTFDTTVGRNSDFQGLTRAQEEELGGVEYRALALLRKIVCGYWFFSQMIAVLILAPYMTYSQTYRDQFTDPPRKAELNPTFFIFFQVWSAWSNNGMSLVDTSMVPFYQSYLFMVVLGFLILMGNTAFPVFLRLTIWIMSKLVPNLSRTKETLQFLLDHPRRCFIYLFPSHQTWLLVFALIILNGIDWISFLVLDIGNNEVGSLPVGTRIIDGLFQAFCVRSAGFNVTNISATAPALQFLYLIMMYVAVYPIALSVRSTNVYEEQSMGIFPPENLDDEEAEDDYKKTRSSASYIAWHARKQLSFDLWWLVLAVWLIAIVEKNAIQSTDQPWITIFSIAFEVSSAYGTVGLSLGTPRKNTSLAGEFRTLSKLILVAVMIRGRHRGLPLAIDRAVLLPTEIEKHVEENVIPDLPQSETPEEFPNGLNHEEVRGEEDITEMAENSNASSDRTVGEGIEGATTDKNQKGWTLASSK